MINNPSSQYFEKVAGQWDTIRAGYFTEAVRDAAVARAYLRPEMIVADVGAGTGFIAAGLAPQVHEVHVIDGSEAMLSVARKNLAAFTNVIYHQGESLALPLPDASLDAVFANMYLHHCPDPLAAILEMARLLRPGGRLIITDMDSHPYEWMKADMQDLWLGFDRAQVRAWFKEAGLVNTIVDCSGESCHAETDNPAISSEQGRGAPVSIFVAVGTRPVQGVRSAVEKDYAATARGLGSSCCSGSAGDSSCCSSPESRMEVNFVRGYSESEQAAVPEEAAQLSLGCGNPTAIAALKPGEIVLDIGSGGGMDAFLAAKQVAPTGHVIGVDMTPVMLGMARQAARKAGIKNVEFRRGQAEDLPVKDSSVDVVISNCVINLCEDKSRVFGETYRALKPGGRLEVSDMVTSGSLPPSFIADPANWAGCVFGALPEKEYLDLVAQAGFSEVKTRRSASDGEIEGVRVYSLLVSAIKPA